MLYEVVDIKWIYEITFHLRKRADGFFTAVVFEGLEVLDKLVKVSKKQAEKFIADYINSIDY